MNQLFYTKNSFQELPSITFTVKFEEKKRAAAGRWMKSSSILGHPPNNVMTCSRWFLSSPIWQVNRDVGNTVPDIKYAMKPHTNWKWEED